MVLAVPDYSLLSLSRDRLSFSKSILRRFIRDCVDRDAAVASPWTVKTPIAERYGVENVMPEETRKGVQEVKNKEIEKRKKVWEDKEGPPSKKQKKLDERCKCSCNGDVLAEPTLSVAAKGAKVNEEDQRVKVETIRPQHELQAATAVKKRYIKYPTEDLDVVLSQRERAKRMAANGHAKSIRPSASTDLPFGAPVFESLLMTWTFFTAFGYVLLCTKVPLVDSHGFPELR